MKPVVTRLYAVLVALALVGLLAWSGADWYQRQQQALVQGHTVLRQAAGMISNLSIRQPGLNQAALNAVFARTTGGDNRWKMLLLSSPDRGTEYYKGPRPAVAVDQAVPRWQPREASEIKVILPVFRAQGDPLYIEGIYEFYGRTEVFSLLKASGLTLVALVVLTALLVVLGARRREPEAAATEDSDGPETGGFDGFDPGPLDTPEGLETVGTLPLDSNDEYWFDESLSLDDLPPLETLPAMEELPPLNEDQDLTFEEVPDQGPSLFSPATGMGWESFLKTRLDHELQRCASQNQDLSLVVLAAKDGEVEAEAWGQAVREAFPSVDLDFEYGGTGAAVVLPGRSLEQALKSARAFVESADRQWGPVAIHAGVAARSGRLLSAETLLGEADSAKRRSLSGTVRVLGLKTDPDRYREHLAGGATA